MKNLKKIIIIEHPKCGRTFLRKLLDDIGFPCDVTHANSAGIRRHYSKIEKLDVVDFVSNRIIMKNQSLIFLYRNPLDVMVSFFHQIKYRVKWKENGFLLRRTKEEGMRDCRDLSTFIRSMYGIEYLLKFWQLWELCEIKNIKFEDLVSNTKETLKDISLWYGVDVPDEDMNKVINKNTFKKLQQKEIKKKNKKEKELKFRKGKINGYLDYMSKNDIEYCKLMIEKYPSKFTNEYKI